MGEYGDAYLAVDIFEPKEAVELMLPAIPCVVKPLVEEGWADYRWQRCDGTYVHTERKQWGELLAGMDKIEDQLRRHKQSKPDATLLFLVEGVVDSDPAGTFTIKRGAKGAYWTRGHHYGTSMSRVWAWLYNISSFVSVHQTFDYASTCQFLVAAFKQDQREEKATFTRYYKEVAVHRNPQVSALMGLVGGIGEAKAKALIDEYVTVWQVLNAPAAELAGVMVGARRLGDKGAVDLLRGIGRTDV